MKTKVIVAIPTYNAGEHLCYLAKQLSKEKFDDVYILDDKSTDNSIDFIKKQYPNLKIIYGEKNVGSGANRNRILNIVDDEIILFIDADMSLDCKDIKQKVISSFQNESIGMVGGLILDKQKQPMNWNYGFEMHPRKDTWFIQVLETIRRTDVSDEYRQYLIDRLIQCDMDYNWVDPKCFPCKERVVDWVAEGLFAIKAKTFKKLSGYDENMSYHEGQDLAKRVRDLGLSVKFNPQFKAIHNEIQSKTSCREKDFYESQFYFFKKHWNMQREVYELLYK